MLIFFIVLPPGMFSRQPLLDRDHSYALACRLIEPWFSTIS